jgi:hypothetical protein
MQQLQCLAESAVMVCGPNRQRTRSVSLTLTQMPRRATLKKTIILGAMLICALAATADAAVIYRMQPIVTVSPGLFEFSYLARLASDQKIDSTLPGNPPHFGVIYDVGALVPGSFTSTALVGGISVSPVVENSTTTAFLQTIFDGPLPNLRTVITGTANFAADTDIFRVVYRSNVSLTHLSIQSAQVLKNAPGTPSHNTLAGNSVEIEVPFDNATPNPQEAVPEPATMVLLGSGLAAAFLRRRARA